MLVSEGKAVYLPTLSVQRPPVDPAGRVTPQTLVLRAGPGYLYPLLVLAYQDLGYQGSPFLLLFQEILGKTRDTELVLDVAWGTPLRRTPDNIHLRFRNYMAGRMKTQSQTAEIVLIF